MTDVNQPFYAVFEEPAVALSTAVALPLSSFLLTSFFSQSYLGLCFPFHLPASSGSSFLLSLVSFCLDHDSLDWLAFSLLILKI